MKHYEEEERYLWLAMLQQAHKRGKRPGSHHLLLSAQVRRDVRQRLRRVLLDSCRLATPQQLSQLRQRPSATDDGRVTPVGPRQHLQGSCRHRLTLAAAACIWTRSGTIEGCRAERHGKN